MGAALAYYTLFAMGPALFVVIAIAGTVFGESAARGEIVGQIDQVIGSSGARAVQTVLVHVGPDNGSILATVIGLITLLIAGAGAFLQLRRSLDIIWRAPEPPRRRHKTFLGEVGRYFLRRIRAFGLVIALGLLLIISLALSAALSALNRWIGGLVPLSPLLFDILAILSALGITTLLFAILYRFLPNVRHTWGEVFLGAFITALLFSAGKELIGAYLQGSATASAFGAAASVILLLIWTYYSAQIVLYGAEFSRVYLRTRRWRKALG